MSSLSPIDQFYQALLAKKILDLKPNFFRRRYLQIYWLRRLIETLFLTALINSTQIFSLSTGSESALSPATGIALSALFLRGQTMLLGIFLGSFISHLSHHVPVMLSLFYSTYFTLYIFLIREACLRWIGTVIPLNKVSVFIKFLLVCSILSIFYLFSLKFMFSANINLFPRWLSEINGILYLTPLCFLFDPYSFDNSYTQSSLVQPTQHKTKARRIYSPPIIVGITLLFLSGIYIGLNINMPVVFALQAILGFIFSLKFAKNQPL